MPRLRIRRDDPSDLPHQDPETQAGSETGPGLVRRLLIGLLAVLLTLPWAWLLNYALNVSTFATERAELWSGPLGVQAQWQSVTFVWIVVLLVLALLGRFWLALATTGLIALLLGAINLTKLRLRNDPLFPSDTAFLNQPAFLKEMVGTEVIVAAVVGTVTVLVVAWLIGRLVGRWLPNVGSRLSKRGKLTWRLSRLVVVVLCVLLVSSAASFNQPDNKWRDWYDSTGLKWKFFDQRVNYLRNGFVGGLLYNMPVTAMKRPAGYNAATMERIAQKYAGLADATNRTRTGSLAETNIVLILSESFTDPQWLKTVQWPESPIPKTVATMASTVSGRLLTAAFGGGTANVEFELLTGQSMSQFTPQVQTPYEQVVPKHPGYPSIVRLLEDQGHTAIALHPFSFRMYRRPQVFTDFGFDKLIDKDSMTAKGRVDGGRFISDKAAFIEVEHQIDTTESPILMHLITMQNHMPYGNQYDDPILPGKGLGPNSTQLAGQYARGLSLTDDALADFLARLKTSKERTAVIFYGDHLPAQVYPENIERREGHRLTHETPWLIWNNRKPYPHKDLPTTSTIQFLPMLFEAAKAPIPPMYALLDTLRAQLPALDTGLMIGPDNKVVKKADLTAVQREVLSDYRLVQYDLSIGKRYTADQMFADPSD